MNKYNYKKSLLAIALGTALLTGTAEAAEFYLGENEDIFVQLTSQLTVGASWRISDPQSNLIATVNGNGGTGIGNTTDDGNLNFKKGDTFSQIFKGVHDLSITKDNFGAFFRVKYWYDAELKDGNRPHGHVNNGYLANAPLSDDGFSDNAKFSGIELLDAYVYGNFDISDVALDLRLGRQGISWGESTFIQGGLNSTNPFDVSALRRPGATLKEGLLPVGMLYANAGITENLSIEGFYQYEWAKTEIDSCGTYFSTADFIADGCNAVVVGAGAGLPDSLALKLGVAPTRLADNEPDAAGQYGVAFRYFSPELNDTDFGLYYMNYHSRVPMISGVRSKWVEYAPVPFLPWVNVQQIAADPTHPLNGLVNMVGTDRATVDEMNPQYRIDFPEDLKHYGVSFATNIGGFALSGEVSYKPDTPIQINGNHVLAGALTEANVPFAQRMLAAEPGGVVKGYDTFDVTQFQVTGIQFYEQVLGASRLTLIGEVGMVMTKDIEDKAAEGYTYGRNPIFGLTLPGFGVDQGAGDEGFVTDSAWGYRARAVLEYPNVFAGVALKPTIDWAHDVDGYSPEPGQQFHEGKKSFGLSLEALYQQQYSATVAYKSFSGDNYSLLNDKDFISVSFGVSF